MSWLILQPSHPSSLGTSSVKSEGRDRREGTKPTPLRGTGTSIRGVHTSEPFLDDKWDDDGRGVVVLRMLIKSLNDFSVRNSVWVLLSKGPTKTEELLEKATPSVIHRKFQCL